MARIFLGLLVILLINKQAQSFDIFGIDFVEIQQVYNYLNMIYSQGRELAESPTLEVKDTNFALSEILGDMRGLSKQLMRITSHEDEKFDSTIKILLDDVEINEDLRGVREQLGNNIKNIQFLYKRSLQIDLTNPYNKHAMTSLVKSILWSNENIDHMLYNIYKLVFPGPSVYLRQGYLSLVFQDVSVKYERLCDKHISPQQHIYLIYLLIIQTELQGFAAITQAYSIQFLLDRDIKSPSKYVKEYENIKNTVHNHLVNYTERYIEAMSVFPRDIRRCDVVNPKYGVNVLELEALFQLIVRRETDIRPRVQSAPFNWDRGVCEDISSDARTRFSVYNCKTSNSVKGCPMKNWPGKPRFLWWKTNSESFGHVDHCPNDLYELDEQSAWLWSWYNDDVCVCSLNYTDGPLFYGRPPDEHKKMKDFTEPKIMKISTEPQLANTANNMIVVGVKFILYQNAIHLQIKQAQVSEKGYIKDGGAWKPVDVNHDNKTINIQYEQLYDYKNIFNLDDVDVDPKYIVTGVRLQKTQNGKGFELHVHSTDYDYSTGSLGKDQKWYMPGENPIDPEDYHRERTEIFLDDCDDPTVARDYHPDPKSNKFIQFQLSSRDKDAGSHTIPFFDAQPVEILPPHPLGGIGLFHRGRGGYGGYIAPRLFSHNATYILKSSFQKWQKVNQMFERCGLKVPVNVTLSGTNLSCTELTRIIEQNHVRYNENKISNNHSNSSSHRQLTNNLSNTTVYNNMTNHYSTTMKPNIAIPNRTDNRKLTLKGKFKNTTRPINFGMHNCNSNISDPPTVLRV